MKRFLATIFAFALLATACGGSDDSSDSSEAETVSSTAEASSSSDADDTAAAPTTTEKEEEQLVFSKGELKEEAANMAEREIGQVDDFFARSVVAGVQLMDSLRVGDTIHILGHATHLTMVVHSMPISDADVEEAAVG